MGQDGSDSQDRRRSDALASSVPDDNHLLMRMVSRLLAIDAGKYGFARVVGLVGANTIIFIWVIAKFGVPAILASLPIIQLFYDGRSSAPVETPSPTEQRCVGPMPSLPYPERLQ